MTSRLHALATLLLLTGCAAAPQELPASDQSGPGTHTAAAAEFPSPQAVDPLPNENPEVHYQDGMHAKAEGDYPAMLDALMAAAELGHAQACYELARLLSDGAIVVKDVAAARVYLERSAELGNSEALRVLAWNHMRGEYGVADLQLGTRLMHQAAAGSVRAQRELGMLYANIYQPNLNDAALAEQYLTLAAQASDAAAAYNLGRLKQAQGDYLDAIVWYEAASLQGHDKAAAALASLSEGEGAQTPLPQLPVQHLNEQPELAAPLDAGKLYQQASAILLKGQRTMEQEARAYAMLSLASDLGHEASARELGFISGIKTLMDRKNPAWLEEEKRKVSAGF